MKAEIKLTTKTILITGAAGFIGANLALELLRRAGQISIIGVDNMNDYYDVRLKEWRLTQIEKSVAERADSTMETVGGILPI